MHLYEILLTNEHRAAIRFDQHIGKLHVLKFSLTIIVFSFIPSLLLVRNILVQNCQRDLVRCYFTYLNILRDIQHKHAVCAAALLVPIIITSTDQLAFGSFMDSQSSQVFVWNRNWM